MGRDYSPRYITDGTLYPTENNNPTGTQGLRTEYEVHQFIGYMVATNSLLWQDAELRMQGIICPPNLEQPAFVGMHIPMSSLHTIPTSTFIYTTVTLGSKACGTTLEDFLRSKLKKL